MFWPANKEEIVSKSKQTLSSTGTPGLGHKRNWGIECCLQPSLPLFLKRRMDCRGQPCICWSAMLGEEAKWRSQVVGKLNVFSKAREWWRLWGKHTWEGRQPERVGRELNGKVVVGSHDNYCREPVATWRCFKRLEVLLCNVHVTISPRSPDHQ